MITGTISAVDYINAQRLHRAKVGRWIYRFSGIAVVLGILFYLYLDRRLGLIFTSAGVGAALGEAIMSKALLPWKVRRLHRQQKDLASSFTYDWDTEFLEGQGISGQSKRPWANYAKSKENEELFLLYHSDNLFEMFPKRWFRDQAQIDEFRRLAGRAGQT